MNLNSKLSILLYFTSVTCFCVSFPENALRSIPAVHIYDEIEERIPFQTLATIVSEDESTYSSEESETDFIYDTRIDELAKPWSEEQEKNNQISSIRKSSKTNSRLINTTKLSSAVFIGALGIIGTKDVFMVHWASFLAGAICCSLSHFSAVPLDVIKTKLQCNPGKYTNSMSAFLDIMKTDGVSGLLSGSGATFLGYSIQGALKFGFYEALKPQFSTTFSTLPTLILASAIADIIASCALSPMEASRIRMVSDPEYSNLNLRQSFAKLSTDGGFESLFGGLPALLLKQVPYSVTQLVSYEILTHLSSVFVTSTTFASLLVKLACALGAGILASIASQPGDCLLTAVNSQTQDYDMISIASRLGFKGLFRGLQARMAHVSTIVTVQLTLYGIIKDLMHTH